MKLYMYAITDRPDQPLPDQAGLDDARLAQIVWRDIAAVVSAYDGSHLSTSPDELWRHEDVLESLMRDRTALPVRFGTLPASRQHVGDMLSRAYPGLVQDIERVRDHVEIGMRFLMTVEPKPETDVSDGAPSAAWSNEQLASEMGPGSAYLRRKLAHERGLRNRQHAWLTIVRDICRLIADHASASRLDDDPDDRRGISAAFLVLRDRIARFREVVGEAAHAHPELALLCTGPWPPYSFVTAGERAPSEGRHAG